MFNKFDTEAGSEICGGKGSWGGGYGAGMVLYVALVFFEGDFEIVIWFALTGVMVWVVAVPSTRVEE
jgi:hypothetical protein